MLIIACQRCYNGDMQYNITVKLHSKQPSRVVESAPHELTVYLNAKPHDGEANKALIKLISKHFKVPKTQIQILRGAKSHHKTITF